VEIIAQAVNNILAEYGPGYGLGWVALGHASSINHGSGWVGSIRCWVGSTNMDPCPSLGPRIVVALITRNS